MKEFTEANSYIIPKWCRMHSSDHFDGVGGCWGISTGLVREGGRDYCRTCGFYRKNFDGPCQRSDMLAIVFGLGRDRYLAGRK